MKPRFPSELDLATGLRIRARRRDLGMTQMELGDAAGVSFQQIQRYENGANRVSASRLYRIALALAVDIAYFLPPHARAPEPQSQVQPAGELQEALELFRALGAISDASLRRMVVRVAQLAAASSIRSSA